MQPYFVAFAPNMNKKTVQQEIQLHDTDYYRNDIKFRYFKMSLASETRRYNTPKQTLQI